MATEVNLPELGESVTEGTVTRWLKQVGDQVAVDEPLLEVSTDKVDTEIPSPVAGTLLEIKANEDDTVEVGAVLALVGSQDESAGDTAPTDGAGDSAGESADQAPSGTCAGLASNYQHMTGLEEADLHYALGSVRNCGHLGWRCVAECLR